MAVVINDLFFSYEKKAKNKPIINGANLHVSKGSIYGLLGPSGCGKTTLLKIVIGLCKPTSGNVNVFGFKPGSEESGIPGGGVGYMPQELSLQDDLTIGEILNYFGSIHCLESDYLKSKIAYLTNLLQLPSNCRLIGNLSGGQKRRLSLAIAILHKPRLLILDEPTVGVDPILSNVIWNLLFAFCRVENTTIIITTHYFEDAKKANVIGFMRKGVILKQSAPLELMREYNFDSLDKVFCALCSSQKPTKNCDEQRRDASNNNGNASYIKEPLTRSVLCRREMFRKKLTTITKKYIIETRRNPMSMALLFVFNLFTVALVTYCVGSTPRNVPIAWVNEEQLTSLVELTNYVDLDNHNSNYTIAENDGSITTELSSLVNDSRFVSINLSQVFRQTIDSNLMSLISYNDLLSAKKDVKKRIVYAVIHLSSNFSNSFMECDPFLQFGQQEWIDNETINEAIVRLYVDASNKVIANVIQLSLQSSIAKFRETIATIFGINPKVADPPLKLGEPIYGEVPENDYYGVREFIAPGFILQFSYGFALAVSTFAFVIETRADMFVRNYVSGVSAIQLILGQIIARFMFLAVSITIKVFTSIYLLSIPCKGSMLLVLILLWMQSLIGTMSGMLMGILIPHIIFCSFVCFGLFCSLTNVGGIFWTLKSQPIYLQWFNAFLPFTFPLQTLRAILIKSNPNFHPLIWPGFAVSFIWIIALFILCAIFLKMKK